MKRRDFIRNTGLSTALIATSGLPKLVGSITGRVSPFTGKPRPEEWVTAVASS